MPTSERYTIGPKLLGDIRQTITRVDAIAPKTSGPHLEPRLQSLPGPRVPYVFVRNDSGADRSKCDILGITGAVDATSSDEFKDRVTFTGSAPSLPDSRGRFVILAEDIADGEIGRCWGIGSIAPVRIDRIHADHQFCEVTSSTTELKTCYDGSARILWTDDDWAYVRLGDPGPDKRLAKFAGTWNKGTTATVKLLEEDLADASPEIEFECENFVTDISTPNEYSFGKLSCYRIGETWFLDTFECDVTLVEPP